MLLALSLPCLMPVAGQVPVLNKNILILDLPPTAKDKKWTDDQIAGRQLYFRFVVPKPPKPIIVDISSFTLIAFSTSLSRC